MAPTKLSGTFTYSPSLGELVLYAYSLCGIRRTALTQEHMADAKTAVNLLLADWLNQGVNLWQVELVTIPLVQGTGTYTMDPSVFVILDGYVTVGTGVAATDRIILPIGRSEWASYPNKQQQGFPTVFWMDRLLTPTVTLWPVPDGQEVSASFYCLQQAQDANYDSGQQPDVPYAWLKALAYGIAEGLCPIYAPERYAMIKPIAADAYDKAARAGIETAQQYIAPLIGGYYRS